MQQARERYARHGLNIAAISYDPVPVLKEFAARKGITYPLLSDKGSRIIRAFGILNPNFHPGQLPYGVPNPGMYIVDGRGVVRAKYFEDNYTERFTASSVLVRQFQDAGGLPQTRVETPHLVLTYGASDPAAPPGGRVTLFLEIQLKPGMHVYAPGVEGGYIPVDWGMPESKSYRAEAPAWPASRKLRLDVINETVPVYEDRLRVFRDITLAGRKALPSGSDVAVKGSFRYQACDDRECYAPRTIPLEWNVRVVPLDSQRASHR